MVAGVRRIIVVMDHAAEVGTPTFVPPCPRPLSDRNVVDVIVDDLPLFRRADHGSAFELVETAPGVALDEIAAKTTARQVVTQ